MAQGRTTRRTADRVRAPGAAGWVVGVLLVLGTGWVAMSRGAAPAVVVVTGLIGVAIGTAVLMLPRRRALIGYVVALVAGAGVVARIDRPSIAVWFGGLLLGLVVGLQILWRRQQQSLGPDAPPVDGRAGDRRRLLVEDGRDDVETTDPSDEVVHAGLHALDGRTRSGFSVFRGTARLDVGGSTGGPLVVYQCDDVSARRPAWWTVDRATAPATDEVQVRVAGLDAHLPASAVTDPTSAVAALDAFLRTGGRAPGLPWRSGTDVDDLRAPFERWS